MLKPLLFAITAAFAAHLNAQDTTAEIDKIFNWTTPDAPGCAVAVSHQGKLVVNRAYGLADLERKVPLSPESVLDAGSVRKQFVAAAVLLLVESGRVSLTDDVRRFIPELPEYGHKITVDHLLTHTSGIRDWPALLDMAAGNPDALSMILRQRGLNFTPGEEWSYSNSGYVLLPMIVARTSGVTFAEFVQKRLFEPLGMKSTSYVDDMDAIKQNRALAYQKDGSGWKLGVLLGNARGGAGALATTARDLATWNEALISGRLSAFVSAKIQERAKLNNGRTLVYARGLFIDANRGGRVVWHTGSADAYKTFTGSYPEQGLSIGIMCNSGDDTPGGTGVARRIFDLFVPANVGTGPNVASIASATGIDASGRAGFYFNDRNEPLRLITSNGRLGIPGGGPLVTVTNEKFRYPRGSLQFMSQDEIELTFTSPDAFELRSMEGKVTRYRRGEAYAPTADDLKAFAGRYESDELRSTFHVTVGTNGLTFRTNDNPSAVDVTPVDRDTFNRANVYVRFRRDASGNVVGFDLNNPAFRNVSYFRSSAR